MVTPDDLSKGQIYWVDRGLMKRYQKLLNIYPNIQKWIPLKVQIVDKPFLRNDTSTWKVLVKWLRSDNHPTKFTQTLPLYILVREYKPHDKPTEPK